MLAGHVGAAMALNQLDRRINIGFVILAATFMDVLLWAFVLLGWEHVTVPADYADKHYLLFDFPYSHSLLAALVLTIVAGAVAWKFSDRFKSNRMRVALVIGAAVFSHWLLDVLVHVPDIPLGFGSSAKVGLSLWQHLGVALAVESLIAVAGLLLFLKSSKLSRWRKGQFAVFIFIIIALTNIGQSSAPPPDNITKMASFSLFLNLGIAWFAAFTVNLDRTKPFKRFS